MVWKKKIFQSVNSYGYRVSTSTGLGKVSQLFLGEPENSKISNYLYCCESYRAPLIAEQGQDMLPVQAAHGDVSETPPNSHHSHQHIPLLWATMVF